jgi:hypothetical protein
LEFFADGHLRSGFVAFDILAKLGVADEVLFIHEQVIKHCDNWHRGWEYEMAVSLAQQALADGFDAWYSRIRGVSKATDDEEYKRNQQELKQKWAARDKEMAEHDQESLDEFRPLQQMSCHPFLLKKRGHYIQDPAAPRKTISDNAELS